MSIKVKCPNGHALKVQDEFAGRVGRCPKCKVKVQVPVPTPADCNDQSIMDFLEGDAPKPGDTDSLPVHEEPRTGDSKSGGSTVAGSSIFSSASGILGSSSSFLGKMKRCKKCGAESPVSYHVCPTCQTYFSDASRRSAIPKLKCPSCGQHNVPGEIFCASCGTDLET